MADTTKLWYYIHGKLNLSYVSVSPDETIDDLKDKIYRKSDQSFVGCNAPDLILTKVDVDLRGTAKDISAGKYQFETNDQPLLDIDTISYVWPELPPEGRLHVYVRPPANMSVDTTGPRRLADYRDAPWLEELRSKLWNRKDLEPELFRTVEVTKAHYDELEKRLEEQHPDRGLPEYDGAHHDVLSIKLDVLRSVFPATAFSPRHPDDNEDQVDDGDHLVARNEDGSEINSLFPFTLSFLDLSTLGIGVVPERLPNPLFLRQEYDHISALIKKQPENKLGSVIVSGQPGTGKTAYLHLRVVQSIIDGRSFLYQGKDGTVYHVNENGVQAIRSWMSEKIIVAFVDGDKKGYEPDEILLLNGKVQIILASSPRGAGEKWKKQASRVDTLVTDLWSPRELFIAGVFLYPFDISLTLLRKSTSYFGYNPRLCFNAAYSMNGLEKQMEEVMLRIRSVAGKESNISQLLDWYRAGDFDVSHSIFEISPKDELRLFAQSKFGAVSRWALDVLLKAYETRQAHAATIFYHTISGTSETASLQGHIFERQVLNYLDGIKAEHKLPIRGLAFSEETTWSYRGPITRLTFLQDLDFIEKIKTAVRDKMPLHLVPSTRNFPAVDSILYDPNEGLTCIQITIGAEHPIRVSGLKRIQRWLKRDAGLADLHPSPERPWRFIFIVPPGEKPFELQRLGGDTARGHWAGMVYQYVLELDVLGKNPKACVDLGDSSRVDSMEL